MDSENFQRKLLEDLSYLRGKFDTAIPNIEKSAENINQILLLHKERLDKTDVELTAIKTKVGIFGGLAGAASSVVITIVISIINHFMFNK